MSGGKFITFEGPEGAGKSTQLRLCAEYLRAGGVSVITTREPGGTPLAEKLRAVLKTHRGEEKLHPETELLLMESARSQHVREVILPALERGETVLCDRFYDSTTAYQGAARDIDRRLIAELNLFASAFRKPDLTFLLDLPVESGFGRAGRRAETAGAYDRFEAETKSFHDRVRQAFRQIGAEEPERVKIINAEGTPDEVFSRIRRFLDELFD